MYVSQESWYGVAVAAVAVAPVYIIMCALFFFQIRVIPRVNSKLLLVPGTPPADKNQPNATTPPLTEVTHLPEVTVYVKCPPTYPSLLPPDCHLSARWMDSKLTPALLSHLRDMFTPGCLVVYEWVMYLQDELVQDYCEHSARSSRERVRVWGREGYKGLVLVVW